MSLQPFIFAFPSAGSYGSEFREIMRHSRPRGRIVRYPGRTIDHSNPASSFEALAAECTERVTSVAGSRPTILIGHSFGAYVAYLVASELYKLSTTVTALVVTGANCPGWPRPAFPTSAPEIREYLTRLDPPGFAEADADVLEEVSQHAISDLQLLQSFVPPAPPTLQCKVYATAGSTDPLVDDDGLAGWRAITTGEFLSRKFSGGHSDLLGADEFIGWLHHDMSNLRLPEQMLPQVGSPFTSSPHVGVFPPRNDID